MFFDLLKKSRVRLFTPLKDQCDKCLKYKNKLTTNEEQEEHLRVVKSARVIIYFIVDYFIHKIINLFSIID